MVKPSIICHMMSSIDGKGVGSFLLDDSYSVYLEEYLKIGNSLGSKAKIWGRSTFSEMIDFKDIDFTNINLEESIPRTDYIADYNPENVLIAIDSSGKLNWDKNLFSKEGGSIDEHIITVLTEKVSDQYLYTLKEAGVSYVFAGKDTINLKNAITKISKIFGIDKFVLEGGPTINGAFLNENLIDEISLLIVPVVDGSSNSKTIFESSYNDNNVPFVLRDSIVTENKGVLLKYSFKEY